jgi:hypothetical protein
VLDTFFAGDPRACLTDEERAALFAQTPEGIARAEGEARWRAWREQGR